MPLKRQNALTPAQAEIYARLAKGEPVSPRSHAILKEEPTNNIT